MKETTSDVIEVRLVSGHTGLEVLQNQKTLSFSEQSWMDLHGETLIHLSAFLKYYYNVDTVFIFVTRITSHFDQL